MEKEPKPPTREERSEIAKKAITDFCTTGNQQYITVRLKGNFRWPREFTTFRMHDRDWLLWPRTEWDDPAIVVRVSLGDGKIEGKLIQRFLSALSWMQAESIQDEGFWTDGNRINGCYRQEAQEMSPFDRGEQIDDYDYLPFPEDEKAQIALALYRESLGVEVVSYKFLSLYKILNILYADGAKQMAWINANLATIHRHQDLALRRINELKAQGIEDIGNYLYVSGRCAIAHAYGSPVVNPDDPDDKRRLHSDLPLITALALLILENEFGILPRLKAYEKRVLHLKGFREVLGADLVRTIIAGDELLATGEPTIEVINNKLGNLSLRVRGNNLRPFEDLTPKVVEYEPGVVTLRCFSDVAEAMIQLDFNDERLNYDLLEGFAVLDDGSATAMARAADRERFIAQIVMNGVLDVLMGERIMSRNDAYIGTNIDLVGTIRNFNRAAEKFNRIAVERAMIVQAPKRINSAYLRATTIMRI